MTPATTEFDIVRGDDTSKKFVFTLNGVAYDMTGSTVTFTAKTTPTGTAVFSVTGSVATNSVTFNFTAAQTATVGKYFYDIQEVTTGTKRHTLIIGCLNIVQDINQA